MALSLLSLPAGTIAVAVWLWLMAETPSQSAVRYVMYWSSLLFIPAAAVVGPYLALSRTLRWPWAALAVAAWFSGCLALVVVWFFASLNQLTF